MQFSAENLVKVRTALGITKAEAARRLNMSAMGYGRYEKGEREPSFQTVSFIAQTFNTSTDYLYGLTDDIHARHITVDHEQNPELFNLIQTCLSDENRARRLIAYFKKLTQ